MGLVTMALELKRLNDLPEGLLQADVSDLWRLLGGPALIHLQGRNPQPLFVSVLLHGNETTGWEAARQLLAKYQTTTLPRSLSLLVGNVFAAREGLRRLDGQMDYNRVWPGGESPSSDEARIARAVLEEMGGLGIFASIDVHNNTGTNPQYACVNRLDNRFLRLATLFGRMVIHFTRPRGTQAAAFAAICPSVTLECGKPGQSYGVEHAFQFLDACLHLAEIPDHPVASHDIDLFNSVAQVLIREDCSFGFDSVSCDLRLLRALDHLNFTEIPAGSAWGYVSDEVTRCPLLARNEQGEDITREYFELDGNRLALRKSVMPSMLTLDERVIRQDCLCYLMERMAL